MGQQYVTTEDNNKDDVQGTRSMHPSPGLAGLCRTRSRLTIILSHLYQPTNAHRDWQRLVPKRQPYHLVLEHNLSGRLPG